VIVSTHAPDRSRWLERGAVEQIRATVDVPVHHVAGDDETSQPAVPWVPPSRRVGSR
jgi:hypothetical protein